MCVYVYKYKEIKKIQNSKVWITWWGEGNGRRVILESGISET